MGAKRKRRRRDEELEEEREQEQEPRAKNGAGPAAPADRALELQKTAGNRAVGAALARWGLPWIPQSAAPQWPKEPQVIADGMVLPLSSFSWSDSQPGTGASPGTSRPDGEVIVTTAMGDHSSDLAQRTAQGRPFKIVVIVMPHKNGTGVTITLTDVFVTGYQISGQEESWTLQYKTRAFADQPPS